MSNIKWNKWAKKGKEGSTDDFRANEINKGFEGNMENGKSGQEWGWLWKSGVGKLGKSRARLLPPTFGPIDKLNALLYTIGIIFECMVEAMCLKVVTNLTF